MGDVSCCGQIRDNIVRTKVVTTDLRSTPLQRCLSTVDLTFIGIGCMLGSGVYVLTGEVAGEMAGPAGSISFLLSGVVAFLSAICYLECATQLPETGASYLYTYVTLGEMMAFMIGWNAVVVRVFATALVSRGWSAYFDDVIGDHISNLTVAFVLNGEEWSIPVLARYPDFVAGLVALFACLLVAVGTEVSAKANMFFVFINIVTIALVFIFAMIHADFSFLTKHGFFPTGFGGVMTGAAACFTGYCGFEAIAFSAEEAKNPSKGLPIGIIVAFLASILCYVAGTFSITVLSDYQDINPGSPFVTAFEAIGLDWMKYLVAVGALGSMTGGLINCAFCLARSIYVIARDGLLPAFLSKTNARTQTPVVATLAGAVLTVIVSVIIDFLVIIQFLSLVAFVEFVIVGMAAVILRYRPPVRSGYSAIDGSDSSTSSCDNDDDNHEDHNDGEADTEMSGEYPRRLVKKKPRDRDTDNHNSTKHGEKSPLLGNSSGGGLHRAASAASSFSSSGSASRRWIDKHPTPTVIISLSLHLLFEFIAMALLTYKMAELQAMDGAVVFGVAFSAGLAIICCWPLFVLPQYKEGIPFKVPLMPFVPLFSLLCNVVLMVRFDAIAWLEFLIWTCVGLILYFTYGMHHSAEGKRREEAALRSALAAAARLRPAPSRDAVITHYDPENENGEFDGEAGERERMAKARAQSLAVVVTRDGRSYSATPTYGSTDAFV
ncbi:high affinity cationic amino acid transporter 1-like [Patiria miniata]|uniref:Cationic amino acid transporter C-terminal domain-containing protein n=1 Tax=Patiria miniata TaxID=46514 RepID=A0A914AA89_PATMI|nr:high affinity cationic amino acid transporter 1-like [Patiria miniata]XP_038060683.1 high affinity cationic amino acid transporter 1-like [Patiria miniata]